MFNQFLERHPSCNVTHTLVSPLHSTHSSIKDENTSRCLLINEVCGLPCIFVHVYTCLGFSDQQSYVEEIEFQGNEQGDPSGHLLAREWISEPKGQWIARGWIDDWRRQWIVSEWTSYPKG